MVACSHSQSARLSLNVCRQYFGVNSEKKLHFGALKGQSIFEYNYVCSTVHIVKGKLIAGSTKKRMNE